MGTLEVGNGAARRPFHHEQDAEIVVGFAVGGIELQNGAEFLFGELGVLLGKVEIAKIVVSFDGVGAEVKRLLKRLRGTGIIVLVGLDDAEQIPGFDAGRLARNLLKRFGLCLSEAMLLNEGFNVAEGRG